MPDDLGTPAALNWQSTVASDIGRVRAGAAALLKSDVIGDLKTAIIRDFFEMNFRNGIINKQQRDQSINIYLEQPRRKLPFPQAMQMLSEIMSQKRDFLTAAENIEVLNQALEDVGRQNKRLNAPITHGNRISDTSELLGTIGDVLSVGEEILNMAKPYFSDSPEAKTELQSFCDKLETLAKEVDAVRERSVPKR